MCFSLINVDYDSIIPQNYDSPLFNEILVKFTYLVGMIADQNFYDISVMVLRQRSNTGEFISFLARTITF
jgi:hypothetical protein